MATTDVANSTSPLSEIAFEKLDIEVETFKQGAEQGVPIAQLILGLFYLDGKKVAQDNEMDASYSNRHLGAKVVICD